MAKNAAFQELLLRKGDKIALGVGGALAGLFLVLGLVAVVGADSPAARAKQFEEQAKRVKTGVSSPGGDATPLPEWVGKVQDFKKIPPADFAFAGRPFEPVTQPDMLAENPKVLWITNAQTDILRVPMLALDVRPTADGTGRQIGVLAQKTTHTKDSRQAQKDAANSLRSLLDLKYKEPTRKSDRIPNNPQPPQGQPGVGGFPGGGGPGGMMGGRGGPGGGMMGGLGGPGGGMMGGGMMGGGMGATERDDKTVVYKSPAEIAKSGDQLAMSVYPLRAVMVNATFPLREQMEEIQRALRIPPVRDRSGKNTLQNVPDPVFDGFDVERRAAAPGEDITKAPWAEFDHLTAYHNKIAMRRWEYINESGGDLSNFLRPEEKLVAPLPLLADGLGGYPRLTQLKPLMDEIDRLKQAGIQPVPPSEWEKRFGQTSGENPYAPGPGASGGGLGGGGGMMPGLGGGGYGSQSGYGGGGGKGTGYGGGSAPPSGGMMPSPGKGSGYGGGVGQAGSGYGGGGPGGPSAGGMLPGAGGGKMAGGDGPSAAGPGGTLGGTMSGTGRTGASVDNLLIRFFDPDVRPGYTYQYKVRMRMKNPNYGQKDKVGRPADATVEVLTGPPQETVPVAVPTENYLYAYPPVEYVEEAKKLVDDNGKEYTLRRFLEQEEVEAGKRAVVQVQRWAEQLSLGSGKAEPIGTWVVAEIPVAPGEYIGRRQLVELPLWSAGAENYTLRELSGGVKMKVKDERHQPKGWPVNFRDPVNPSVLVDFDGGRVKARVGDKAVITDDSAAELLILRADGKLTVHNSAADKADPDRTERTKTWDEWLKRVKDRKGATGGPGGMGGPGSGFGRPGAGGAGGPGG